MKRLLKRTVVVALAAVGLPASAAASDRASECRTERLDGLYVFSATGYTIVNGVAVPKAIVELIRFNGDGTLTSPGGTVSINGAIIQSVGSGTIGTYSMNENCIGTLSFSATGPNFDIFMSPRGEDAWMIQTNPNNVFQGNVTRVSLKDPPPGSLRPGGLMRQFP